MIRRLLRALMMSAITVGVMAYVAMLYNPAAVSEVKDRFNKQLKLFSNQFDSATSKMGQQADQALDIIPDIDASELLNVEFDGWTVSDKQGSGEPVATVSWGDNQQYQLTASMVQTLNADFKLSYNIPPECDDVQGESQMMWCAQKKMAAKKIWFESWAQQNPQLLKENSASPE